MSDIPDQFLSWQEAAKFLRVSTRTLARWHAEGKGPPRIKFQRQTLYYKPSLIAWLLEREQASCRT